MFSYFLGAAYDTVAEDFVGEHDGSLASIQFYQQNLKIQQIRDIYKEGKYLR